MPTPVTRLFAELFPQVAVGWARGADRYGLPPNHGTFGAVNCWFYYSPGHAEARRRRSPRPRRPRRRSPPGAGAATWRTGTRCCDQPRWPRAAPCSPRTSTACRTRSWPTTSSGRSSTSSCMGPQHFAAVHGAAAAGALAAGGRAAGTSTRASWSRRWPGRPRRPRPRSACSIASPTGCARPGRTSSTTSTRCGRSAATRPRALDELSRTTGGGSSTTTSSSPRSPSARPRSCRRSGPRWRVVGPRRRPTGAALDRLRERVPEADRDAFDELVADARAAYGANDDNTTVLFALPLGPRASRGARGRPAAGGAGPRRRARPRPRRRARRARGAPRRGGGPSRRRAGRSTRPARIRARAVVPPPVLGDAVAHRWLRRRSGRTPSRWSRCSTRSGRSPGARGRRPVACRGHGRRPRRARAGGRRHRSHRRAPAHRARRRARGRHHHGVVQHDLPAVAAVAVQHGGLMSHAAVLARELGLTGADRRPRPARPGARRRSGGGRPDRRHHHGGQRASHLRATPA